jgi:phenylacetate-CoA ligase
MQIVQEQIDRLLFRIVKGESFAGQTESDLARLAQERFGDRMHWAIEYVDSIQSERSGKYRFCISKLPNPFS